MPAKLNQSILEMVLVSLCQGEGRGVDKERQESGVEERTEQSLGGASNHSGIGATQNARKPCTTRGGK